MMVVKQELQNMEEMKVIEPSYSAWASPIVVVPKKDGTIRLCVDYRKFNSISHFDAYPMPRVEEIIDRVGSPRLICLRGTGRSPSRKSQRKRQLSPHPLDLTSLTPSRLNSIGPQRHFRD